MGVERTLAIIKPGDRFPERLMAAFASIHKANLAIIQPANRTMTRGEAAAFYAEHKERTFFEELISYMTKGNCYFLVLEGSGAISTWRAIIGETDPKRAEPGTLRAEFGRNKAENGFHGSDSNESAKREIEIIFPNLQKPHQTNLT